MNEPGAGRPTLPEVRTGNAGDAGPIVRLIAYLGHPLDEVEVSQNLAALARLGEPPLVATLDGKIVGMCGLHRMVTVHRDAPVGRISALVVAEEAQGRGIGRLLVDEAERRLREAGCRIVEVTSNDRREGAHAFYQRLGYARTSTRFMKPLDGQGP